MKRSKREPATGVRPTGHWLQLTDICRGVSEKMAVGNVSHFARANGGQGRPHFASDGLRLQATDTLPVVDRFTELNALTVGIDEQASSELGWIGLNGL